MLSNFSTEKTGILLENLSKCQNSSKGGSFPYNFYEPCNVFQFFNREDGHFARKSSQMSKFVKKGSFAFNFYEASNCFQIFNREDGYFAGKSF